MNRRLSAIVLATLAFLLAAPLARAERQRSVVVVVVDTLRPDHLQTYGYKRPTSPNLLKWAQRATVFDRAYSASSWTRPAVLSLMTGEYPSELSSNPGGGVPLVDDRRTLATVLKSYGYRTGGIYNTAQLTPELSNMQQGFDHYLDYGDKGDTTEAHIGKGIDHAIEFLDGTRKPAFLFLHILDPHHPYLPDRNLFGNVPRMKFAVHEKFITPVPNCSATPKAFCHLALDRKHGPEMAELYDSEIVEVDRELARLFKFLENDSRYTDALVVLTSDHGEEFGEHGGFYHGARMYEETIRIPLIIRDPARPHSIGRRVSSFASLVDLTPTILQAVGITFPPQEYSGRSLVEYLTRRGGVPRDQVVIEKPGCACRGMLAIRKGDWKMIVFQSDEPFELYNLRTDPGEKKNLAATKTPAVAEASRVLYEELQKWHRRVARPLATRHGGNAQPIPPELRERLKALGYLQ